MLLHRQNKFLLISYITFNYFFLIRFNVIWAEIAWKIKKATEQLLEDMHCRKPND